MKFFKNVHFTPDDLVFVHGILNTHHLRYSETLDGMDHYFISFGKCNRQCYNKEELMDRYIIYDLKYIFILIYLSYILIYKVKS